MCFEGLSIGCTGKSLRDFPVQESGEPSITGIPNLEQMLRRDANQWGVVGSKYILRVHQEVDGRLHIYVRPSDRSGTTLDFWIDGNILTPIC
jgi:hypothetical protein